MTTLNRRDFLRALGITGGASALSACNWDDNQYLTPVERIFPYVVKPEQVTPGTYTFFATTVTDGPAARSVTARHRDGRVTFISHNRHAPGRPAVGSAPLLEMQRHYSPDRLQGPSKGGQAVSWEDALAEVATAVRSAVASGKQVAFLGGYRHGALANLIRQVAGDSAVFWEPLGYESEVEAAEQVFGERRLPFYGLDKSGYILSFGAPFLAGWGDANIEERYATARDPNVDHRVTRFALVSSYRDQTGANCDDWFSVAPQTEVAVARAIASLVARRTGASDVLAALGQVNVAEAASAAGLSEADLEGIAANLVASDGIALPGGVSGSVELAAASYLINVALKAPAERFHLGGYAGQVDSTEDVLALFNRAESGGIGVLFIDDVDPVYALGGVDVAAKMQKAGLVVSLSSHPSATQAAADLTLPGSGSLEDWGDVNPLEGIHYLRQPAMSALYDTRSVGDILLAVAKAAELPARTTPAHDDVSLSAGTWAEYLRAYYRWVVWDGAADFDARWTKAVVEGVVGEARVVPATLDAAPIAWPTPAGVTGDLVVIPVAHHLIGDGRHANQPWAQEISDPLSGNLWGSWLEVSKDWAAANGLKRNDLVSLTIDGTSVELPVEPRRGIREGVALLAFGQGQEQAGRYAKGYGVSLAKLSPTPDRGAWKPLVASWSALGRKGTVKDNGIVSTMNSDVTGDEKRNFGVHVYADEIAKVGDAPSKHPGELTGIHHLELDPRLTERGETYENFYLPPDHSTYRFGMTVDVNSCTGCNACVVACYAENNLPVVGRERASTGKHMSWIRINRYWEDDIGGVDDVRFVPMMCQHCGHAGCENVCPVLATYHNIDGLNAMVYNRCVGTRYCSNACPFSVRRFNYHTYVWPEPFNLMLNPDVSTRTMGVMEKCTFCVQRLRQTKSAWKDQEGFTAVVPDEQWQNTPACVEACPSRALTFGNREDPESRIEQLKKSARTYEPLEELNVKSAVNYLAKANFHHNPAYGHHGSHDHDHDGDHTNHDHGSAEAGSGAH